MILNEIKQVRQTKTHPSLVYDLTRSFRHETLGKPGHQAHAFLPNSKPNTVVKVIQLKNGGLEDPMVDVIKLFIKHSDNPYFPRIYTAKIYMNEDQMRSKYYMIVTMEKLHSIRASNEHLFETSIHLFKRLRILPHKHDFKHPLYSQFVAFVKETNDEVQASHEVIFHMFADRGNRSWLVQNTPDDNLKEALEILEQLFRANYPDLHVDNLMIRLTGVGPQIVLMDPIVG